MGFSHSARYNATKIGLTQEGLNRQTIKGQPQPAIPWAENMADYSWVRPPHYWTKDIPKAFGITSSLTSPWN